MGPKLIFKTQAGNNYLTSIKEQLFTPITPLMIGLINKIDATNEKDFKIPEKVIIDKIEYHKEEIEYYFNKYKFLKRRGFLSTATKNKKSTGRISSGGIQHQLANITQLVFEVTDACNLKCKYCAYGELYCDYDKRENNYLSFSVAKKLIDRSIVNWQSTMNKSINNHISISFYGGEPLLNIKLIKEIIKYIENKNIPFASFKWNMTTNGMLLDKQMDYLVKKDFSLLISLDGNEFNHSYRLTKKGENSFEQVVRNIKLLMKNYPKYFDSNVNFNTVLHNRNSVEEIISFIKKEFGKIPSIGELSSSGIRPEKESEFIQTYRDTYESIQQSENHEETLSDMGLTNPNYRELTLFVHKYSGNVFKKYSDLLSPKKTQVYLPTGTCFPFERKLYLSVNGKILPCERIGQQFFLGQVTDKEIILDYNDIATIYNNYFDKLKKQCSICYRFTACTQCIFNLDSIDMKKTVCKGFLGLTQFKDYLSVQISLLEKHPELYKEIMEKIIVN